MAVITEHNKIYALLAKVTDPEIPVLSVTDMGIIRDITVDGKQVTVTITPTYSGCPAMDTIARDIHNVLVEAGYRTKVESVLSPPWTTDWITKEGRDKLEAYGIAPPLSATGDKKALFGEEKLVKCTHCGSTNTRMVSQFGSTACKALFQCNDCLEPFDYFKCI